ncbi:MAG: carboxylesterase family protein [Hespellia sp.]|nr:carboxylesterase family protein [Hespellia sp.]
MHIQTRKGIVEGNDCGSYYVFKGIPYAKPPIGELRWKAPREMDEWNGIYEAKTFGKIPMQDLPTADLPITGRFQKEFYSDERYIPEMNEDCLYLNVWMPADAKGKKLPVAFWIHGGGFGGGFSSEIEFDGEKYCEKDVILVTIGYRVNVFGFLAHPWLDAENERNISGNYGILDQIAALKWTYENIAQFGGDPTNITVFGQSAGSMSTQVLVSSELTDDMISKAIMQSGISCEKEILATPTLKEEEEIGEIFVELTGTKTIQELRNLSSEEIMEAKRKLDGKLWALGKGLMVVPNKDGYVLKETVKETWKNGNMKSIPYMAGVVTDDLGATEEEIKEKRTGQLMEECKKWSLKREEIQGEGAYLYFFSHELPGDDWGAFHTGEVWYTFGTLGRCWRPMTDADYQLSEEMVTYWTNFMKTGNPADEGTEEWRTYTESDGFIREFK